MERRIFRVIYRMVRALGLAGASFFLLCSYDYLQPPSAPFTVRVTAPAAVYIHDTLKICVSVPEPGVWGVNYLCSVDSLCVVGPTNDTMLHVPFSVRDTGLRRIAVKAVDGNGSESPENVFYVEVMYRKPAVVLHAGMSASVHTVYPLMISGYAGTSPIDRFIWYVDTQQNSAVTEDTLISIVWNINDTGAHVIVVQAVDGDGICSPPCSLLVNVLYQRPAVTLLSDSVSFSGAQYLLQFSGTPGENPIDRYIWYIDDPLESRTIVDTLCSWVWGEQDTGLHRITVYAVDRKGVTSDRTSLRVTVLSGAPVIEAISDTVISSDDTLTIICRAADPNGAVERYLWNFSGGGWDDSTADSSHLLWYCGSAQQRVAVGARDNDGLVSTAAFTVTFNRPNGPIIIGAPVYGDTLVLPERIPDTAVAFVYRSSDPDGDEVVYSLWWRADTDTVFSLVYQGTDESAVHGGLIQGRYFWRLEARDSWGHWCADSGMVVIIREHRICFVGHSVVIGLGGSDSTGGFRKGVLDSLRRMLGPCEKLKPVGPMTSNWFMTHSPADDSCMAVSGISAEMLYGSMVNIPSLTADIWVLMIGVTDDYNPKGIRFASLLMDLLSGRNMDSRIFVCNGNPITPLNWNASYWLPSFNQGLPDSIAVRTAAGAHVFLVDAFTALSDSLGQYDSALFVDGQHPNQTGYDRLRDAVYSAMKGSDPPVIRQAPY